MPKQQIRTVSTFLMAVIFVAAVLFVVRNQLPTDIVSPYIAGWLFDHGQFDEIYNFPANTMFDNGPPAAWLDVVEAQNADVNTLYPYLYPPIWAALIAPLTRFLTISEFSWAAYIVQIPLIYATIFLAWRICGQPWKFVYWGVFTIFLGGISVIGLSALAENQPHIFVVFLIVLGVERWLSGHYRLAGFVLALAATVKIFPVFILLLVVARRDWRLAAYMVFWGLLITGLSLFLAGIELHLLFLEQLQNVTKYVFLGQHNLSLSALLYQLQMGENPESIRYGLVRAMPIWISIVNGSVMILGLAVIMFRFAPQSNPNLIIAMLILLGLTSPFGWSYYYLPLIYFWPMMFMQLSRNRAILATYLVFIPLLSLFQNQIRDAGFYNFAQISAIFAVIIAFSIFFWLGLQKNPTKCEIHVAG